MKKRDHPLPDHAARAPADYARGARPLSAGVARVPPPKPTARSVNAGGSPVLGKEAPPRFLTSDDGLIAYGGRIGHERELERLRRGELPLFDTLDLHGFTASEAEAAVRRFFARARGHVARAVLVVHGKGTHSPGGQGVLRAEITSWLTASPIAHHVLCFATARARHGGRGALYVLLAPEGSRRGIRATRRGGGRAPDD